MTFSFEHCCLLVLQHQQEHLSKLIIQKSEMIEGGSKLTIEHCQSQQSRLELGLRINRGFWRAKESSLQTHIGATERRFIVRADEKLSAFWSLKRRFCR